MNNKNRVPCGTYEKKMMFQNLNPTIRQVTRAAICTVLPVRERCNILGKWPTWCTNSFLCIYFIYILFITLYMFRTHRAHHQERQIVSIQPLVTVTLCWWPCRVQVGSELQFTSNLHTTRPLIQSDSNQRLYWYNLSLLMMSTMFSKHVESYK
jgi:hypothetical protein